MSKKTKPANTHTHPKEGRLPACDTATPKEGRLPACDSAKATSKGGRLPACDTKRFRPGPTLITLALTFVVTFVILIAFYGNYMRKIEGLSLFLSTGSYFRDCMSSPGGLVVWLSTFLTQFMVIPWAGALIYALLLTAITAVGIKAFGIPRQWRYAAVVPAAMILLAFTNLGYLIFTVKPAGYAFALPVGVIVALLLCWLCGKIRNFWLRLIAIAIIILGGYPLLGFYALFAALLVALRPCGNRRDETAPHSYRLTGKTALPKLIKTVIAVIFAAILIALWPQWWFYNIDTNLILTQLYINPLPRFYSHEIGWKVLYSSIFAIYVIVAALAGRLKFSKEATQSPKSKAARVVSLLPKAIGIAALVAVLALRYTDRNFFATLDLDRALWEQNWTKAASLAKDLDDDPTRINTVLAYIALMRTGEAGQSMFAIADGKSPYATTRGAGAFNDAIAPLAAYHLGLLNYAYRWATESSIGQGVSVERLKMMTKIALLNYEPELAGMYLDILYNTPFHREWARKYMHYKQNPMSMKSDPEFAAIIPLLCNPNEFINDGGGAFESYVWPLLARGERGTSEYIELAMQASLISRDLDAFMRHLADYTPSLPRIPRYYQEAALLWSLLQKQLCPIPIDPTITEAHNRFLNMFRATSQREAEDQREAMRDTFGDTYWYYFVFNDDMLLK